MLLTYYIAEIDIKDIIGDITIDITSIAFDSRNIYINNTNEAPLYIAQRGYHVDGHSFIEQAIFNGAKVIVCESLPLQIKKEITYIIVDNSSKALGIIASLFYNNPSKELKLVGITGTNGKTTTVTLLHELMLKAGRKSGLLSTIENRINYTIYPSTHTTPDAIAINKLLRDMVTAGCEYAFMEVSSHAIVQNRISGLYFTGAIFSNITHDHLDFHKTFPEYIKAKKNFFDNLSPQAFALYNKDDKNGSTMIQNCSADIKSYSLYYNADFKGKIIDNTFDGMLFSINGVEAWFKLIGKFNAYNLLAIYGTAVLLGLPKDTALVALTCLESVSGRFQIFKTPRDSLAIVDYAHTPDAVYNILSTIANINKKEGEIITVIGCGGDRDSTKRSEMAEVACKLSNKVILTSDNPRTEKPAKIIADMMKGVPLGYEKNVLIIENRREAIKTAAMILPKGSILLIAGKGHENYQEINGVKYDFDDMKIVKEIFTDN